ncbi:uncharacterized protein LOC113360598 [Papaver somniferum]|uniref:uncharacterized protein LOC113360598 n=1 Tax=Papaver somniferum TaxID=3469 RepID=UPI000E702B74|nr:uncharacterized protein LOC113360598 [Papaver somniferum]
MKLDGSNYLLWRDQFERVLVSTDLYGYVNGEIMEPPRRIIVNGVEVDNANWVSWRRLDRFVSTFLKATFTSTVSGDILGLTTTKDIWDYLETSFRTQFRAKKNLLRTQLNGIKKGNQSIIDHLKKIKTIADSLAAIGEKVSGEDVIMFLLNGLGSEYDVFVVSSQNRETPYTFGEIKARLLSHEKFLSERQHQSTKLYDEQTVTAFYGRNGSTGYNNNRKNGGYNKNDNGGSYKNIQYQQGSISNSSNGQSLNESTSNND